MDRRIVLLFLVVLFIVPSPSSTSIPNTTNDPTTTSITTVSTFPSVSTTITIESVPSSTYQPAGMIVKGHTFVDSLGYISFPDGIYEINGIVFGIDGRLYVPSTTNVYVPLRYDGSIYYLDYNESSTSFESLSIPTTINHVYVSKYPVSESYPTTYVYTMNATNGKFAIFYTTNVDYVTYEGERAGRFAERVRPKN